MPESEMPVALPWLTFAAAWLLLGLAAVAIERVARRWLAGQGPSERASLLFALALLPLVAAALVTVLAFAPLVGGWLVDRHCHADGCWPHVPRMHADAYVAVPLAAALLLTGGATVCVLGARLRRSVRAAGTLLRVAERRDRARFELLETRERIACCVGLLRPRVVVSRGTIEALAPSDLDVVLAHEQAHAERRDNLRQLLAALSLFPVPVRWRQALLAELALAAELACDRAAAGSAGGTRRVAEALTALRPRPAGGSRRAAFGADAALDARLAALAAPEDALRRRVPTAVVIAVGYVATVLGGTSLAHHAVELVVAVLG